MQSPVVFEVSDSFYIARQFVRRCIRKHACSAMPMKKQKQSVSKGKEQLGETPDAMVFMNTSMVSKDGTMEPVITRQSDREAASLERLAQALADNITASELIDEWRKTSRATNVEELRQAVREAVSARLSRFVLNTDNPISHLRTMLLHQYDQSMQERRSLDVLGWSIYGLAFAISLSMLALSLSSGVQSLPSPARLALMIVPLLIHAFGYQVLRKIRIARHLHRAIATAIEEYLGLFHLTVTKISNRPLRTSHDTMLRWVLITYAGLTLALLVTTMMN